MLNNDANYVEITYRHRNRGQHAVYGPSTGIHYGYRAGGSNFLVHKDDVAAQPGLFEVVQRTAPKVTYAQPVNPTPAPQRITPGAQEEILSGELPNVKKSLDLQTLPGVTPAIAKNLAAAGLDTAECILEGGVDELVKVKGVGESRAKAIIEYVSE